MVVNFSMGKFRNLLLLVICVKVSLLGCAIKKQSSATENTKNDHVISNNGTRSLPIVIGVVRRNSDNLLWPMAAIKVKDSIVSRTDNKGFFRFILPPGKYRFRAVGLGAEFSETGLLKISSGDTLKLNFYLFDLIEFPKGKNKK